MFCICTAQYWNRQQIVTNVIQELNFRFYLILINVHVNSGLWLVAAVWYSTALSAFTYVICS